MASVCAAQTFPLDPDAARREAGKRVADAAKVDGSLDGIAKPGGKPLTERPFTADEYRKLFLAMWGQVPNWKSGDPLWARRAEPPIPPRVPGQPRPKRPPPHEPDKTDWVDALLSVDPNDLEAPFLLLEMPKVETLPVAPEKRDALRADSLDVVTRMRALAATHRPDAVQPLFDLAFVLDGVFRDECGRQIRAIGDAAVAPLVRLQYSRVVPGILGGKERRYAVYQLDRMDRARPSKAITTAPDDRMRAELIHVYGEVRAPDAVEAVLDQINAASHHVRREARWAFRRYVEGPPPPPAPKRKRRLPGGGTENDEKPDYLTYREIAELALQKRMAELQLTPPEKATPLQMFEAIVAHDDGERVAEWERMYVTAQEQADKGDLDGAIGSYEWILAHDPSSARRSEMAPTFARAAEARQRAGKLDEAAGFYWKAAALAPPDQAKKLEAQASFLDAERAAQNGREDEPALRRTLELDPANTVARDRLTHLATMRAVKSRSAQFGELAIVLALCVAASGITLSIARRRHRKGYPPTA